MIFKIRNKVKNTEEFLSYKYVFLGSDSCGIVSDINEAGVRRSTPKRFRETLHTTQPLAESKELTLFSLYSLS